MWIIIIIIIIILKKCMKKNGDRGPIFWSNQRFFAKKSTLHLTSATDIASYINI